MILIKNEIHGIYFDRNAYNENAVSFVSKVSFVSHLCYNEGGEMICT